MATSAGEDPLKRWTIVLLTILFSGLYVMAIAGTSWTPNDAMIKVVQPIVYVIIGYYFGRMPGEQHERKLKEQIDRTSDAANEAIAERLNAERSESRSRQKLQDALETLQSAPISAEGALRGLETGATPPDAALRQAVAAAVRVLQAR